MTCPPNQRTSKCKIKPIKSHPVFYNKRARFSCCHCFSFLFPFFLFLSYLITLKGKCIIRSGYFLEIKANCNVHPSNSTRLLFYKKNNSIHDNSPQLEQGNIYTLKTQNKPNSQEFCLIKTRKKLIIIKAPASF